MHSRNNQNSIQFTEYTAAYPINFSCKSFGEEAKSKAQNDFGSSACMCLETSTGGLVMTGAALPKNGYVYL